MAEIDKKKLEELRKITGFDEGEEHKKKKAKIFVDSREQYTIRIPKRFADLIKINPDKDCFEFHLLPVEGKEGEFLLEAVLVRE